MKIPFLILLVILTLVLPFLPLPASAANLPEIPGFTGEEEQVLPLSSATGSVGQWTIRIYRRENGSRLKVTLLTGAGPGVFSPTAGEEKKDDRPIGFGSTYEVLSIGGRPAVLEEIPSLGLALAVPLNKEGSLTLESSSLTREEMLWAASVLLPKINPGK